MRYLFLFLVALFGMFLGNFLGIQLNMAWGADCSYVEGEWSCPQSDNAFNPPVLDPIVPQGMSCETLYVESPPGSGVFKWVRICK